MKIEGKWHDKAEYYRRTYSTKVFVEIMLLIETLIVISCIFLFLYSNGIIEHVLYGFSFVFILFVLWYSIKFRKGVGV